MLTIEEEDLTVIRSVTAKIQCDECGEDFTFQLDPAGPETDSIADEITDMLRGGVATEEPGRGFATMDGDKMLCRGCTRVAEAAEDWSEPATAS